MTQSKVKYITFIFLILIVIFQTIYFIHHEMNIYYWDYNGYWRSWENFIKIFNVSPLVAFNELQLSVFSSDYNIIPIIIPSLFGFFNIPSRLSYVLALNIFYLIPTIFLFQKVCLKFSDKNSKNDISWMLATLVLPLFFVGFWSVSLIGYPDLIGLVCVIVSVLYVCSIDFSSKVRVLPSILLGGLLWSPFLCRRWFAFTVVSIYLSAPFLNYYLYNGLRIRYNKMFKLALNFFIAGIVSCVAVIFLQGELVLRILHTDYSEIYIAYQTAFQESVWLLIYNFGVYLLPLFFAGVLLPFLNKDKVAIPLISFCLFNLVFSFIFFTRTQAPGIQHCLPFCLWMLIITIFGYKHIISLVCHSKIKSIISFVLLVCYVFIFVISLNKTNFSGANITRYIFPRPTYPLHIDNFKSYVSLTKDLESLTKDGGRITVLSSNNVLNDDMLNTLSERRLSDKISFASQVDLRDEIHFDSLLSDYFVVTDPPQTHLTKSSQQVITIPVQQIINNKSIGQAMIKLEKTYNLSKNVKAYIFKKIRPYKPAEIDDFFTNFFISYPQWNGRLNKGLYYTYLSTNVSLGDVWGTVGITYDGKIAAHPGEHTPTKIYWDLRGVNTLKIRSMNTSCKNADGVDISIWSASIGLKKIHVGNGLISSLDVHQYNNVPSVLSIDKHISPACDSIEISGE